MQYFVVVIHLKLIFRKIGQVIVCPLADQYDVFVD